MLTRGDIPALGASRISFSFLVLTLVFAGGTAFLLEGCASPGEPIERKPLTAEAVGDLSAQQVGNAVALSFTVPEQTPDRRPLGQPLAVEIFRDFVPASVSNPRPPTTLLVTIPPAMTSNYEMQGRFHYTDELTAQDFSAHPDSVAIYDVRTRASSKKNSAASNVTTVQIYPLPDAIADLKIEVTHSGIQLTWTTPTKTPVGAAPPITGYRVYRALVPANGTTQKSATNTSSPGANTPLTEITETQSPEYLDSQIQFGNSYLYAVRSVASVEGELRESGDSNRVTVVARDSFPPAPPEGLLVVPVPVQGDQPSYLELSWNISLETDLAGYNVYRSDQSGVQGTRINPELLPTPAFRDMNAVPGHTYFYSVTGVDRFGNESAPGAQVQGETTAANHPGS